MKVSELIEVLQQVDGNLDVAIPVELGHVTMGGQPYRTILRVDQGFDWDSGKVFLKPEDKLTVLSQEEYIELIRYKQLISSMRGHQDRKQLDDIFIKKDKVREILHDIFDSTDMNLEAYHGFKCAVSEAKLEDK